MNRRTRKFLDRNVPLRRITARFTSHYWFLAATVSLLAILGASVPVAAQRSTESPPAAGIAYFEKFIRPVLVEHCYKCHSAQADDVGGDLRLDSARGMRVGGSSGPAVLPGKPDDSLLLDALRHETFEMPPDQKLSDRIVDRFAKWIAMGAPDPRHEPLPSPETRDQKPATLWSFRPVRQVPPPSKVSAAWQQSAIDAFLASRWEAEGLTAAPLADRRTLIRRLYYDLIGLPPTPAEVRDFLQDRRPDAWERLIDKLLASPQFGEHWGRHWLDIARYADSSGGGRTLIFHEAWRYRDYIVRALNRDVGWDILVQQHIAGDLMPAHSAEERAEQLTATGFMVLGPNNYELQDKELLRMEVIDEQLETIGRAFLGLTLGCARCHDHKFDPVTTKDYYALAGFLWSSKSLVPGNVSGFEMHELPLPPEQQARWNRYLAEKKKLTNQVDHAQAELKKLEKRLANLPLPGRGQPIELDDDVAELRGTWQTSQSVKPFIGQGYRFSRDGNAEAEWTTELPGGSKFELAVAYTPGANRTSNARIVVNLNGKEHVFSVDQRQAPNSGPHYHLLGEFSIEKAQTARVQVVRQDADGVVIIDAIRWTELRPQAEKDGKFAEIMQERKRLQQAIAQQRERWEMEKKRLKRLAADSPPAPPKVMGIKEQPAAADCALCIRGDVHRPGPKIPRGFISAITPQPPIAFDSQSSGRLELAYWITSPEHPLTARVLVNRIWLHLMGEGVVRTPDNFGSSGEPPTHPELLDYLAAEFRSSGWSLKRMVRRIVLSRTYRLSTHADPNIRERDPDNRWWTHANRRPLGPEALRDTWLVFSGELDRSIGGPSLPAGIKSEFDVSFDSRRRSLYLPLLRNQRYPLFSLFDGADPNVVTGKRSRTILATQALFLMNNEWLLERAETAARRLLSEDISDETRIGLAFERLLCRPPTPRELELARKLLVGPEEAAPEQRVERWTQFCHGLMACLDCRYLE